MKTQTLHKYFISVEKWSTYHQLINGNNTNTSIHLLNKVMSMGRNQQQKKGEGETERGANSSYWKASMGKYTLRTIKTIKG